MAHTSTSRRRFGAALSALGVTATATAALIGLAGTAGAHTPAIEVGCSEDGSWAKVELKQYNDKNQNGVVVVIDGETVVDETFGKKFKQEFGDLDPTVEHTVSLKVEAWDDSKYDVDETRTIEACVEAPPSSETSTSESSSTPVPTESSTPEATPSETAPVTTTSVEVEEAALAETGASIAVPLVIGGVLLAGGVVLMIVVRRRGRA